MPFWRLKTPHFSASLLISSEPERYARQTDQRNGRERSFERLGCPLRSADGHLRLVTWRRETCSRKHVGSDARSSRGGCGRWPPEAEVALARGGQLRGLRPLCDPDAKLPEAWDTRDMNAAWWGVGVGFATVVVAVITVWLMLHFRRVDRANQEKAAIIRLVRESERHRPLWNISCRMSHLR